MSRLEGGGGLQKCEEVSHGKGMPNDVKTIALVYVWQGNREITLLFLVVTVNNCLHHHISCFKVRLSVFSLMISL